MTKKNIIVVTGGAGFVGSNLIEKLLSYNEFKIISIDNYSTGKKYNHIKNNKIKYINCNTLEIEKKLSKIKNRIKSLFHFGEFSRIHQSFEMFDKCFKSNLIGSKAVFQFCLDNKIKLIYSATSASLGNNGVDKNLSPYAFTKSKNLELLENLKNWFNFKFEVIYFYNVYGPRQITQGEMATVIGIFENQFKKKTALTVVKPGTQTRRFTHIDDTIKACINAWVKNKNCHYAITSKSSYSIQTVAKMFKRPIKFLPERKGERYSSSIVKKSFLNRVQICYGQIKLKNYIEDFIRNNSQC